MTKFFDNLNIVFLLRILAIVVFMISFIGVVSSSLPQLMVGVNNFYAFTATISMLAFSLLSSIVQPALILGLAEIIRLLRENKND